MVVIVHIPADGSCEVTEIEAYLEEGETISGYLQSRYEDDIVVDTTVLVRRSIEPPYSAGLYAYSLSHTSQSMSLSQENIRATRLAMACGWHSQRFYNDIWLVRSGYKSSPISSSVKLMYIDLSVSDIWTALYSPDLRKEIITEIINHNNSCEKFMKNLPPDWLLNAAMENYHDRASLAALKVAMTRPGILCSDGSDGINLSSKTFTFMVEKPFEDDDPSCTEVKHGNVTYACKGMKQYPIETTLCLNCRCPTSSTCKECNGAYFCPEPSECKMTGWSHQCLCPAWNLYVRHRIELSSFLYFSGWHLPLLREVSYCAVAIYKDYLTNTLGVITTDNELQDKLTYTPSKTSSYNWWSTEMHGWSGGGSVSAKVVNIYQRLSYIEGFGLNDRSMIPVEKYITDADINRAGIEKDQNHMPIIKSWEEYYRLRSIPSSSPVALLATFPVTVYYSIQHYGTIPLNVALMLERPLKLHVVGVEKELNFIDFFKEVGFLLPEHVRVDMSWIVRKDMLPLNESNFRSESCKNMSTHPHFSLQLTRNLNLTIFSGTYGDDLDPNFDIVGGCPDMIIGLNAGLYAYDSWRHVVSFLHHHSNVLGVFTDYNEYSGVNCASLGGERSRESLEINPFRQPRAMPVYCMNLPQFSNGFIYVFNAQDLEE